MVNFPTVNPSKVKQNPRVTQQRILPTAVKPAGLAQTTLVNTSGETLGPFALADGDAVEIQSIITNSSNPQFRLGAVPFCITFFKTSISTSNIIGNSVSASDYRLFGPVAMANFTPLASGGDAGGSDGNNLVILTTLTNNTGGAVTIYAVTNTRVYNPLGGGAS